MLEDGRQASLRVEWDAAILRILRVAAGNRDLMAFPVNVPVPSALSRVVSGCLVVSLTSLC